MNSKYKVAFMLENGVELNHKEFVRENGALWYIRAAPKMAKKVKIEKLENGESVTIDISDRAGQPPKFVAEVANFLGIKEVNN